MVIVVKNRPGDETVFISLRTNNLEKCMKPPLPPDIDKIKSWSLKESSMLC